MAKNKPTPPSPRYPRKRIEFFRTHQADYSPDKLKAEAQRFAFTPQGQAYIKKMKEQDNKAKQLSDLKP